MSSLDAPERRTSVKLDAVSAAAADLARTAAQEAAGGPVGEHVGVEALAERVVAHHFAADVPGYAGWHWCVAIGRAARSKVATVEEVVLLPGADALLAPAWVPWSERIQSGDLAPGDLLHAIPNDPRLVPAYSLSDDPAVEAVEFELGIGRVQVMSREGRLDTAERWAEGETGPNTAMARNAPARCGTCGFYLQLAGSLAAQFGVCGNLMANSDGRVVSAEHGCGAHSEVVIDAASLAEPVGQIYDDEQFD